MLYLMAVQYAIWRFRQRVVAPLSKVRVASALFWLQQVNDLEDQLEDAV